MEVKADDPATRYAELGVDPEDSDEVAEIRVLAKKMLRKNFRDRTIEDSYNRFVSTDREADLPSWFVVDEARNFKPFVNLTKEEVADEKATIKAYNARPSKKVEEAKARKRKRLSKAMTKVIGKAQVIANQDLNESSKMKQI